MIKHDRSWLSATLCNASMLLYMTWLLLPAVQTTLKAITGIIAVGIFGVGVLLDGTTLRKHLHTFLPRVLLAAALPLALFFVMERGGNNLPAYLVQQGMFWFPLVWCAYAHEQQDARLYRFVKPLLITLVVITTLTTMWWLIEGMLRGDRVYAYARSLGSGEPGREAYLKELMQRNIGGYDFIYALVLLIPTTFYTISAFRGWRRVAAVAFLVAQLATVVLSQYTYAIVFAAAIVVVELLAGLLRILFKKLKMGTALLCTVPFIAALWLFRVPLVDAAGGIASAVGFSNAAYSMQQLLAALTGAVVDSGSRLTAYMVPWEGFLASPLIGSLAGGTKVLGMHSDFLDMLSAAGLLGTAVFGLAVWVIGRAKGRTLDKVLRPQRAVQWLAFAACIVLGTVFYSREISLVMCLTPLLLQGASAPLRA